MNRSEAARFVKYNAVGAATTLVGLPVMAVLGWAGVPYQAYTALNYLVGIGLGFWLNFKFSFADRGAGLGRALFRYLVTFLALLALVQGLQFALIDGARWPAWTGVGVGMVVYAGVGYVVSRWWVFAAS